MEKTTALIRQERLPRTGGMIGHSKVLRSIAGSIQKLALNDATVLITGETGVGKEVAARAIHDQSRRRKGAFVAVNCGCIPAELCESELFGHERGSFTNAIETTLGKFEQAHGGTLFLDEIGTLPLMMQVKFLRAIQEREITRVGSNAPVPVDVRLIAATNVNLKKAVEEGTFRDDLYHRLNVVPLAIAPLRQRTDDIVPLLSAFVAEFNVRFHRNFKNIEEKALDTLCQYTWPGNIRELKNLAEHIAALEDGPTIKANFIPVELRKPGRGEYKGDSFFELVHDFSRNLISEALEYHPGNHSKAARYLGIKRTTLISKMKQYKLKPAYSR